MPVLDGNFEAFVTNLGKYNEGMLVGEWVKLPTTEEEMQKVFERIGIGKQDEFGQPYEEWFITDYECPIYGVQKMLGEYENLDKLNYLAALIDELSLSDQEMLLELGRYALIASMVVGSQPHAWSMSSSAFLPNSL